MIRLCSAICFWLWASYAFACALRGDRVMVAACVAVCGSFGALYLVLRDNPDPR